MTAYWYFITHVLYALVLIILLIISVKRGKYKNVDCLLMLVLVVCLLYEAYREFQRIFGIEPPIGPYRETLLHYTYFLLGMVGRQLICYVEQFFTSFK